MPVDKKKLGALVQQHGKKKMPPKKPGGGKPPHGGGDHHEPDGDEHGGGGGGGDQHHEEDHGGDAKIAEQQAQRIEGGNGDDELMDLASDVDHEDESTPAFALDEKTWERAKKAVRELEEKPEDEVAVIVHTYKALGGEIEGHEGGGGEGDEHEDGDEHEPEGDE